ncbi:hypothetical protein LP422_24585 [Janibacter limosus]|uniref:hypothetical protein n=1 Tax=Janibacter limosus TaxID=53458 RepID=UPI0035DEFA44|nr:hypothetical protein LP422_24585 [Janibacter limosus]
MDDPDGGRHGAGVADDLLGLLGDLDVARAGQTVGEDRRLEGHDGAAGGDGLLHLGGDADEGGHGTPRDGDEGGLTPP